MDAELLRIVRGVHGGNIFRYDGQVGFGLADGNAWLEVTEQEPELRESILGLRNRAAGFRGNPHIGIAPAETWGHYADEGALRAVEDEGFVDEFRIAAEAGDPGFGADDENWRGSGLVISGLRDPAKISRHTKEFKSAGGDEVAVEALRAVAGAVKNVETVIGDDAVKDMILRDIVEEFGTGESGATSGLISLGVVDLDGNEAGSVGIRKRLHQDIFDHAKDGGGRADAEGEGDGGGYGKGGALAEVAEREADILAERAHGSAS